MFLPVLRAHVCADALALAPHCNKRLFPHMAHFKHVTVEGKGFMALCRSSLTAARQSTAGGKGWGLHHLVRICEAMASKSYLKRSRLNLPNCYIPTAPDTAGIRVPPMLLLRLPERPVDARPSRRGNKR